MHLWGNFVAYFTHLFSLTYSSVLHLLICLASPHSTLHCIFGMLVPLLRQLMPLSFWGLNFVPSASAVWPTVNNAYLVCDIPEGLLHQFKWCSGQHQRDKASHLYFCPLLWGCPCALYIHETQWHLSPSRWTKVSVTEQCRSLYVLNRGVRGR